MRILAVVFIAGLAGTAHAAFAVPKAPTPAEEPAPRALSVAPSPHLSPKQVVEVQLRALARDAEWGGDLALSHVFRFASPANRAQTGPLPRFAAMVRGGYGALVNHARADIGPLVPHHGAALFPVEVEDAAGNRRSFVWVLSRQTEGPDRDCWLTDAVFPANPEMVEELLRSAI